MQTDGQGKSVKCKWNSTSGVANPSEFNLSNPTDSAEGFSLDGHIVVEGDQKKYKMTFDLVNWTDTSIENLIGEIPNYVCRNSTNMSIVSGAECPDYDTLYRRIVKAIKFVRKMERINRVPIVSI